MLDTATELHDRFQSRDPMRGTLRIGVSENVALVCLPELLGRLEERCPAIKASVFVGDSARRASRRHHAGDGRWPRRRSMPDGGGAPAAAMPQDQAAQPLLATRGQLVEHVSRMQQTAPEQRRAGSTGGQQGLGMLPVEPAAPDQRHQFRMRIVGAGQQLPAMVAHAGNQRARGIRGKGCGLHQPRRQPPRRSMNARTFCCCAGFRLS